MKPCMVDPPPLSIVHVVSQCSHVISELGGLDIEVQHCVAEHDADKVFLTPLSGATSINSDTITCKTKLTHGTYLYMFYFVSLFSFYLVLNIYCFPLIHSVFHYTEDFYMYTYVYSISFKRYFMGIVYFAFL